MTVPSATVVPDERASARWGRRAGGQPAGGSRTAGYFFVAFYVVLLLALGIAPTVYAFALALSTPGGLGFAHFINTFNFFDFAPAFEHILEFEGIWLVSQTILVVILALMVHTLVRRVSSAFRFVFYLPGAMAGAASVVVWLFMFDPHTSPWAFVLHGFHYRLLANTVAPGNLPVIFAIMAFFTGAGGWIVIMYGALNNIPRELIEAAEIDGSNAFQTALRIKLPLIRKWIVYMLVLSFAAGSQLFVEPQILGVATVGEISPQWSPNQLAYYLAFQLDRFNDAAAISVDLLVIGLLVAVLLVWRGRLFEVD
ncbi:MAG TPA: sugar ABC transporter permease [Solirubrobacteraceae bacterium]|nr:sugar ABC transporter permease [Solirubrobacteraceae bacterium]